ncbi:hypothetical protein [Alkalicoccobacillus plakortidis]|uniref:Uncharacterized protein n=1 Tax=Alkalicoccobacillus plakortidis TaxID=444060 RepID=A0ABT0XDU7_9BACI|nr:hypothetical protein [Alkalicoccobacillus plakortidis]MCM2674081.1 hypothetical protein [Alkalicoccobacillus plakortidis]
MKNTNECSVSIEEQDELLLRHQAEQIEHIQESKDRYRKIVRAGISRWVTDFQNGHIQLSTVDDLKKLIELDIELQKDEEL